MGKGKGKRTRDAEERSSASHESPPSAIERVLDALDLPQVLEHLEVLLHAPGVQHGVERRRDLVLEREDVPAELALGELEHARVEPAERVGVVGGGGRAAEGGFECRGEVVAVESVGWSGEGWAAGRGFRPGAGEGRTKGTHPRLSMRISTKSPFPSMR